jgi:hypothetical protein
VREVALACVAMIAAIALLFIVAWTQRQPSTSERLCAVDLAQDCSRDIIDQHAR